MQTPQGTSGSQPSAARRAAGASRSRGTGRMVLMGGLLAAAVGGAGWMMFRENRPAADPPEVHVAGDVAVASLIKAARSRVLEHPRSGAAWGELGTVLLAHDFQPEAERCFAEAAALEPREFRWPYLHGVSAGAADPQAALGLFRRTVELRPDFSTARLRLAEACLSLGRLEEAEAEIRAVLRSEPQNPRAELALARVYFLRGEAESSRQWAERSAAHAPHQPATHELLSQVYFRLQRREEAEEHLRLLASLPAQTSWEDPVAAEVLMGRHDFQARSAEARRLSAEGNYGQAISIVAELVERQPEVPTWSIQLAHLWLAAGRPSEAERVLQSASGRAPQSAELRFHLGVVYSTAEDWRKAALQFNEAIERKPDYAAAHYNLGHALARLGDNDSALEAFQSAARIQPDFAQAHTNAGKLLLERGEREDALHHLRLAVELSPNDPVPRRLLEQAE